MSNGTITDVPGIIVGQAENLEALTGCTIIICKKGATGGVDQRGGAPGTRETDAIKPMHLVDKLHAVVLSGGSAYGLDASSGVMKYLEEEGIGFNTGVAKVPIVSSAVLFDLAIGSADIRPDSEMGYTACKNASVNEFNVGNYGAGTGASVGKILGPQQGMKSGIGTSSIDIGGGIIVGAVMAVNALGDIIDPDNGNIIAGARSIKKGPITIGKDPYFANTLNIMKSFKGRTGLAFASKQNTMIGVVATNAKLTKEEVNKVAQMAQDGIAMAVRPAHTMFDGDTIFAMATNQKNADVNIVGAYAAQAVADAIINGTKSAKAISGLPSYNERQSK